MQGHRRGNIDNCSTSARSELGDHRLSQGDCSQGIGGKQVGYRLARGTLQSIKHPHSGVVNQHIDLSRFGKGLRDTLRRGDVKTHQPQAVAGGQQTFLRDTHGGDNPPAMFEKITRRLQAKTRGTAGDHNRLHISVSR